MTSIETEIAREKFDNHEIMVSVFCLAYNHEDYIKSALDGFVNQKTSFRFEVIVHDDASTDKTADIIRDYAEKYPDIIRPVFQTENQYSKQVKIISTVLLPLARGKYYAFCEGDDYWCDDSKLQSQVDRLERNEEFVASVHNTAFFDVSTEQRITAYPDDDRVLGLEDCVMRGSQSFHTSSVIVRRNYYINAPSFVKSVHGVGDYPRAIYYSLCGPIHYCGKVMSVYRVGTEGSWTKRIYRDNSKHIKTLENIIKMLRLADDYSGEKYHRAFCAAIKKHEYQLHIAKGEYRAVVISKELFKKEKLTRRIVYRLYALCPAFQTIAKKTKRIIHK